MRGAFYNSPPIRTLPCLFCSCSQIIDYGELVEVQTQLGAMTEAVLDTAINYSNACETGAIIHISTGT